MRRRKLRDLFGGSRQVYNLHGIERNTLKSVYNLGWRKYVDGYSGGTYHTRISEGFRAMGVDNAVWKAHNMNIGKLNKHFRKIEP